MNQFTDLHKAFQAVGLNPQDFHYNTTRDEVTFEIEQTLTLQNVLHIQGIFKVQADAIIWSAGEFKMRFTICNRPLKP